MNEINLLINDVTLYYPGWCITVTSILAGVAGIVLSAIAWKATGKGGGK